jgi:hypothetical protein
MSPVPDQDPIEITNLIRTHVERHTLTGCNRRHSRHEEGAIP